MHRTAIFASFPYFMPAGYYSTSFFLHAYRFWRAHLSVGTACLRFAALGLAPEIKNILLNNVWQQNKALLNLNIQSLNTD